LRTFRFQLCTAPIFHERFHWMIEGDSVSPSPIWLFTCLDDTGDKWRKNPGHSSIGGTERELSLPHSRVSGESADGSIRIDNFGRTAWFFGKVGERTAVDGPAVEDGGDQADDQRTADGRPES
jgi:hypothetical protein